MHLHPKSCVQNTHTHTHTHTVRVSQQQGRQNLASQAPTQIKTQELPGQQNTSQPSQLANQPAKASQQQQQQHQQRQQGTTTTTAESNRSVSNLQRRINELDNMGFDKLISPYTKNETIDKSANITIHQCLNIGHVVDALST